MKLDIKDILAKVILGIFTISTILCFVFAGSLYCKERKNENLKKKIVMLKNEKRQIEEVKNVYKETATQISTTPTTITTGNGEFNISIGTVNGNVNINGN